MDFIKKDQIEKAVKCLYKIEQQKNELLPETNIFCSFTLIEMMDKLRIKPILIPIQNAINSNAKICFFSKDPQQDFKPKFKALGIKVIGVKKLQQKYKAFEQKRELLKSFDLFICDSRIIDLLPKLLGKTFFQKKKHPIPIDMTKNLELEITKIKSGTVLHLNKGVCT